MAGPSARGTGRGAAARDTAVLPGGCRGRAGGLRHRAGVGADDRGLRPGRRPGAGPCSPWRAGDAVHGRHGRAASVHAGGDAAPAAFGVAGACDVRHLAGGRLADPPRGWRPAGVAGGGRRRPGGDRGHPAGGEPGGSAGRAGQGAHCHRPAVRGGRLRGDGVLRGHLRGRPERELVRPVRAHGARARGRSACSAGWGSPTSRSQRSCGRCSSWRTCPAGTCPGGWRYG